MGLRLFRVAQAGEAVLAVLQEDGEWHEATVEVRARPLAPRTLARLSLAARGARPNGLP